MIKFLLINMVLECESEDTCSYYYECDQFVQLHNMPGVIEFKKSILDEFDINGDRLMYAADHILNGNVKIVRNAQNCILDGDGVDWIVLFAMEAILTSAREKGQFPKDLSILGKELQDALSKEDNEFKKLIAAKAQKFINN